MTISDFIASVKGQEVRLLVAQQLYRYQFPTKDFDRLPIDVQQSYLRQAESVVLVMLPAIWNAALETGGEAIREVMIA